MKGRNFWYYLIIFALAALPLAGCSGGGGSAGSVASTEKGVSLTVQGQVDAGKSLGKTVGADTDPLSGTVKVLNGVDATVLGSATIGADGSFSGLAFTLPATKSIIVFRADTNKAVTPFYTIVPIDLSNPPAPGIGASNAITILISQASTNTASVVSSALGFSGALPSTTPAVTSGMLGDTGNSLPTGQSYTTAAQLVTQYGGQILAYNTSGLNLTGSLKETLLPAQDASTLTGDELLNIALDGKVTGVSIPGNNPIISFQVTNKATGKGIRGLKTFGLTIAQLKPAANGSPSEWASYMLTASGTTPGRPSSDSGYTVLDNGDGSYAVKFGKDIKNVTNAGKGVTYDANLTHRVAVQVRTAPVAALTATGVSVTNFRNEANLFYDFVPATPAVTPAEQRMIVKKDACEACHTKIGVTTPHGGRNDPRYCVLCHTPQRGNGRDNVASTDGAYPALTETVRADGRVTYSPATYIADGVVLGDFPVLIHKIHMGEELTKKNYNFANVLFNEVLLPQPVTNCRTCHIEDTANLPQALNWKDKPSRKACGACHDNIDYATGANLKPGGLAHVIQTDDSACGSCHGATSPYYPDKVHKPVVPPNPNNVFLGGTNGLANAAWLGTQNNLPEGVHAIGYDIKEVTKVANATDPAKFNPSITFKFKKNGTDVLFNTYAAGSVEEMITGFVGSPSVYFAWAVPQDGIASPADYNATAGTYIKNIWRGDGKDVKGTALSATAQGTMTGPDASGYYTLTMPGVFIPSDAVMLTGGIGFTYSVASTLPLTQIDVAKYPYTPNSQRLDQVKNDGSFVNAGVGGIGGISVPTPIVYKVATGYTGRRLIVSNDKCNTCHAQLGVGPTFHGGQRNNAQVCSFCHTPNRATSHTSTGGGGWAIAIKDMVHAIHGGKKRTIPFTYEATTEHPKGFSEVVYPGILNNCAQCHITYEGTSGPLAGTGTTYDFTAAPRVGTYNVPVYTSTLMSSLLWSTGASSTMPTTPGPAMSPFVTAGTAYGSAFSYNANTGVSTPAATTNLVHSPMAAACFACHDSSAAQAHMKANGGSIYAARSTVASFGSTNEQCLICHGPGKVVDIKSVHRWR